MATFTICAICPLPSIVYIFSHAKETKQKVKIDCLWTVERKEGQGQGLIFILSLSLLFFLNTCMFYKN